MSALFKPLSIAAWPSFDKKKHSADQPVNCEPDTYGTPHALVCFVETVASVFRSRNDAQRAALEAHRVRLDGGRINLLLPGASEDEIRSIRTSETEQPGMGATFGGVLGGSLGLASGFVVEAAVSALIPGVGPVLAIGATAAALLGIGGAVGGAAVGSAAERKTTEGLPADEIFFYEDALRQGRSVVLAMARDHTEADWLRHFFVRFGAETLDAARHAWWIGLRDAEKEHYKALGRDFEEAEVEYRAGFEAALRRELRGRSFIQSMENLKAEYPETWTTHAFRCGFDRGQLYLRNLENEAVFDQQPVENKT